MESIDNFKVEFQLNSDSTYRIGRHNYFFDKYEGKARPQYQEGRLTQDEFTMFAKLITASKLEKMADSYGFDREGESDSGIVYIIELKQDEKSKFISVKNASDERLSDDFTRLMAFTGKFISDKIEKAE